MSNADKTNYPNISSGAYWTNNGAGDDGLFTCPTYYLEVPYLKPR